MIKALITIGIVSIVVFTWSTIMIYSYLRKKGEKIESFIFIRLFIFQYVSKYKTITRCNR